MDDRRLSSLDAFRGLAVAAMILVGHPGTGSYVFPLLRPAAWHGWTPADLVAPLFLFIVGVSLAFSLSRRREEWGPGRAVWVKVVERSVVLFGLGLFLQLFPLFRWGGLRLPGVLQRVAVCYFLGSLIYLRAGLKERLGLVAAIVVGYWLALKLIPVPGHGAGGLDPAGNLPAYVDVKLLAGHLRDKAFDPAGILSSLSAVATTLTGTLVGDLLRSTRTLSAKFRVMFVTGVVLTPLGVLLHRWLPINGKLWTSSYVIFSAGAALLLLSLCFFLIEVVALRAWAFPFLVFGRNAILAYVGLGMMARLIRMIFVTRAGERVDLQEFVTGRLLAPWAGPFLGSLLWAVVLLIVWFLIILPLHRKRIFLKA
jgi:predicted acyltransferase